MSAVTRGLFSRHLRARKNIGKHNKQDPRRALRTPHSRESRKQCPQGATGPEAFSGTIKTLLDTLGLTHRPGTWALIQKHRQASCSLGQVSPRTPDKITGVSSGHINTRSLLCYQLTNGLCRSFYPDWAFYI